MASDDEVTQNPKKEEDETILYDLFFPYEWSQESEPLVRRVLFHDFNFEICFYFYDEN